MSSSSSSLLYYDSFVRFCAHYIVVVDIKQKVVMVVEKEAIYMMAFCLIKSSCLSFCTQQRKKTQTHIHFDNNITVRA